MAKKCFKIFANALRQPVNAPEYILSPCVESELGAIWARMATHNPDAATRVIDLAFETFAALAREPGSGRSRQFRKLRLKNIRSWHIPGLDNYLVFYRPITGGIQVLHVSHGARDIETLLGQNGITPLKCRRPTTFDGENLIPPASILEEPIPVHIIVSSENHSGLLNHDSQVSFSSSESLLVS
jgi:toxin ParE1/3/4